MVEWLPVRFLIEAGETCTERNEYVLLNKKFRYSKYVKTCAEWVANDSLLGLHPWKENSPKVVALPGILQI